MSNIYKRKYSPSLRQSQVLYKQCFLSLEICSVLRTRGWSLPDVRSWSHLHAGSDRPILPDAARNSQQRRLLDPSDRVTLVQLKHCKQYPFAAKCSNIYLACQYDRVCHRRSVIVRHTACTIVFMFSFATWELGRREPSG